MTAPQWEVYLDGPGGTREPELVTANVADTANPFGSFSLAEINDVDGERYNAYSIYQDILFRVFPQGVGDPLTVASGDTDTVSSGDTEEHIEVNVGGTLNVAGTLNVGASETIDRFPGFVADIEEQEQGSADRFVVEAHSYDQYLRGEVIDEDLSGSTIFDALNTIITTYTPVTWNASNVEVGDNQELTQSFRGEKVEDALLQLSFKSVSEEFGVNRELEFFFRPLEADPAPNDLGGDRIIAVDEEEDGRAAPNEVTVFFDGGDRQVTVSLSPDKLDRQDAVGTDRPVTKAVEITREDITDIGDAEDAGRRYLNEQQSKFLADVTTVDLYDGEIGDVIGVESQAYDVHGDFRIAGLEYVDAFETVVSIVDRRKEQDQRLVNFGETLDRVEQRPADRDSTKNTVLDANATALFTVTADVGGTAFTESRFVNSAREKVRDAWRDPTASTLDITHIAVGTDASGLNRTNTALQNETEREAVGETLNGSFAVDYEGTTFTEANIREIGLFDTDGDLVCRLTRDEDGISNATVTVSISVANDDSVAKGLLTDTGRTTVRDVVADNSPDRPAKYGYGDDGTEPAPGDTALGNQLIALALDSVLLQDASTTTDWDRITDVSDTDALSTANDQFGHTQTAFFAEAENADTDVGSRGTTGSEDNNYSGATGRVIDTAGDRLAFEFTPDHTIPAANVGIQVRVGDGDGSQTAPAFTWTLDGQQVDTLNNTGVSLASVGWVDIGNGNYDGDGYQGGDLGADETHTLAVEVDDGGDVSDEYAIDCVVVYDDRFNHAVSGSDNSFDNTTDGNDTLDDPALFPWSQEVEFTLARTRRDVTEADIASDWVDDNVANQQAWFLKNSDTEGYLQTDNSETASETFASPETNVQVKVRLSRYGSGRTTATPNQGFNGQAIGSYELTANPDAFPASGPGEATVRAIAAPGDLASETLQEAGLLTSSDATLTRSILAALTVDTNERIISAETNSFDNA